MARSTLTDRITAAVSHPRLRAIKTPRDLSARLIGLGIVDVCYRCSGSGDYGPRSVQGGVCFACGGRGKVAPKTSRALEQRVRDAVTPEILDAYADRLEEQAAAKREARTAWPAAKAAYAQSAWYRYWYPAGRWDRDREHCPLAIALIRHRDESYDRALRLAIDLEQGRGTAAKARELIAAVADYLEALARIDRAHALALESGAYAASTADYAAAKTADDHDAKAAVARRAARDAADLLEWV